MSSTLKHLEDLGWDVFDNFPLSLAHALVDDPDYKDQPVAIGLDTRSRGFDPAAILDFVKTHKARLLFLTADENILQKRFTETRRRHPLAKDRPVSAGIKKEQTLLHDLKIATDMVIDTSLLSIHDLRHTLEAQFGENHTAKLAVTLMSFGFRYGLPREADIVMDVRFLKNPHWNEQLKPKTGRDKAVAAHIEQDESCAPFLEHFKQLVGPLLPRYSHEGKSYLTIALGCTGGKHRSVYVVEQLKPWLENQGLPVYLTHRDIER